MHTNTFWPKRYGQSVSVVVVARPVPEAMIRADAPSFRPDAFPAVTVPSVLNAVFKAASFSIEVSGLYTFIFGACRIFIVQAGQVNQFCFKCCPGCGLPYILHGKTMQKHPALPCLLCFQRSAMFSAVSPIEIGAYLPVSAGL